MTNSILEHNGPRSLRRETFRLAKFVDTHITKDDGLMSALETAYTSRNPDALADVVAAILHGAETTTYTRPSGGDA